MFLQPNKLFWTGFAHFWTDLASYRKYLQIPSISLENTPRTGTSGNKLYDPLQHTLHHESLFQWPLELLFWTVLLSLNLKKTPLFYPLLPQNKFVTLKTWGSVLMYGSLFVKEYFAQYSLYSSISRLLPPSTAMKKLLPCFARRAMMASTLLVTAV